MEGRYGHGNELVADSVSSGLLLPKSVALARLVLSDRTRRTDAALATVGPRLREWWGYADFCAQQLRIIPKNPATEGPEGGTIPLKLNALQRALVPAALAVLVSYLVQTRLAERLRYRGLYEWQVASRAESPAHHAQHLAIALRLLRERDPGALDGLAAGAIDLVSLLRSGVPVELPDGHRLIAGVLRADSRCVNRTLASDACQLHGTDTRVVAILRGKDLTAPGDATTLQAGDRLVLISRADVGELQADLDPW